ncbi:nucleotide-diphospho-sugar transferase [Polychytrium aggregatum]|uniref:nucleotide-diphospho-sugar transferase n=1 Tax=Polychytrium aggregatum TaxID=110093 RepID=UPI0022FE9A11|nr:nucleotide-diphospho-sugar transferase [Polychytrium aggregatum]KAI9208645.1 nucleotide-diphospho-sugar transferase [Polychytrium aggregatum]
MVRLSKLSVLSTAVFSFLLLVTLAQFYLLPSLQLEGPVEFDMFGIHPQGPRIPQIIHQSWKTSELPKRFEKWANTWKRHHPTWTYVLWTDDMNRRLIETSFPWFLDLYDALPKNINRADASRYFYMYKYGGVYADLDMECLRAMDAPYDKDQPSLTDRASALIAFMGTNTQFEHSLPNAWMASAPGHPFWMFVVNEMIKARSSGKSGTEELTGPVVLHSAWKIYSQLNVTEVNRLVALDHEFIFPYDWSNSDGFVEVCSAQLSTLDEKECKRRLNAEGKPGQKAYALTYWSHTWEPERANQDILDNPANDTTNTTKSQ